MTKSNLQFLFAITLCAILSACATTKPSQEVIQKTALATSGDAQAQFDVAVAYDYGNGVSRNLKQAAYWYKQAAEQNHASAQNSLGSLYQAGNGVEKNLEEAFKWYQKATDQGHAQATNNLAYLYDLGLGVEQNRKKAMELYQISADKGFYEAMFNLGISYTQGLATEIDYIEAYKWIDLARYHTQRINDMKVKWTIRGVLDQIQTNMTKNEILEAKKRSREWSETHQN